MSFDFGDRCFVDLLARYTRPNRRDTGSFCIRHSRAHGQQYVWNVAMDDRPSAIAVIQCCTVLRENINNHRLASLQRPATKMMAVGSILAASYNRSGIGVAAFQQPDINRSAYAF